MLYTRCGKSRKGLCKLSETVEIMSRKLWAVRRPLQRSRLSNSGQCIEPAKIYLSVVTGCTSQAHLPPFDHRVSFSTLKAPEFYFHRIDAVCCGGKQFLFLCVLHSSVGQQQIWRIRQWSQDESLNILPSPSEEFLCNQVAVSKRGPFLSLLKLQLFCRHERTSTPPCALPE
jgi:hypothetical protein